MNMGSIADLYFIYCLSICYVDFNAKLSDFGFSKTDKIAGEDSKCGSLYYAPPEMFFRGFFDTFKADIWSIGITLYCLTENSFPYDFGNENYIIDQITSQMIYLNENMPKNIWEKRQHLQQMMLKTKQNKTKQNKKTQM